jgi:DNA polymerase III subunit delta
LAVVKSDQFETFLKQAARRAAMFLLHSGEAEIASARARRLVAALVDDVADPFQVVRLSAETLAADPGRLADEALAISMFGGRRVVWVEAGGRDLTGLVEAVADALPKETSLVIEAGVLKRGAPMRALFETRPNAATIECWAPQAASLAEMVDAEARRAAVRIDPEARRHLVNILAADPATAESEIAKLMIYAASTGALEAADIDAVAAGAGASPADALVDFALGGDLAGLERGATEGLADSGDAGFAALQLARRVALLMQIRTGGEPERLHRLPLAVKNAVLAQARSYAPETLARRLPALLNLLVSTRREPDLASAQTFRALSAFALSARRRGEG